MIDTGGEVLVHVENLEKHYPVTEGVLNRQTGAVRAVDGISFDIPRGDTFGLVGESGCGKTTTGKGLLRLTEPTAGTVEIDGTDILSLTRAELRQFRRTAQMVFQDPTSSLNPRKRVGNIIAEPLRIHGVGTEDERQERVSDLLEEVNLPSEYRYKYPSALSGGQKQRVGIARAIALNPDFLVLDEPTSALDVSVQARIVDLFDRLQAKYELTYLFISHDLSLIKNVADWIGVMYLGELVEVGPTETIFANPQHPYTRALLSVIPTISEEDAELKPPEVILEGEVPDPRNRPSGCGFRTRCPHKFEACEQVEPPLIEVEEDHLTRCLLHDGSYSVDRPPWVER